MGEIKQLKPSDQLWHVPYQRNYFFTGREKSLQLLHETLTSTREAAIAQPTAISGLPGIGKTQMALEYAYRYREEYRHVLWVQAETDVSLVGIARLLELSEANETDQNKAIVAVKRWLQTEENWLLILDNVEDLNQVRLHLPPHHAGSILLTTRLRALGSVASPLQLPLPSEKEGALQLLHRARILPIHEPFELASLQDQEQALALARELGCLPLALDQAGAYIEETPSSLHGYLTLYQQRGEALRQMRGEVSALDHPSVSITFSLALEQIQADSLIAADLIRCCAFLASDIIPEELFNKGAGELGEELSVITEKSFEWDQVVRICCRYSLLQRTPNTSTLSIHRLVQEVIKDGMDTATLHLWNERVIRALKKVFPQIDYANWEQCDRLVPHVITVLQGAKWEDLETPELAPLLHQAAYYLQERAQYAAAQSLYERAIAIHERIVGTEHPDTAMSLNNLAVLYDTQGKYSEAEPLVKRALAIRERALGAEHPYTAQSLNNLAALYDAQGKYSEAEPLLKRALTIYEKTLGAEHPETGTALNNLALHYKKQGNYSAAEPLYKRALAICEKVLGGEHPDTPLSLNNLAALYNSQGNYSAAEPLYERALAICEKVLGEEHPDTALSLTNLGGLYKTQRRYVAAEPLLKRALTIRRKVLGDSSLSTARSFNNLAGLYDIQEMYAAAEPLYERALAIYETVLGAEDPNAQTVAQKLELIRSRSNKLSDI